MNLTLSIIALMIILLSAVLLFWLSFPLKGRIRWGLRPIPAFAALQRALGLSVEEGTRLHLTLGNASITQPINTSALVGLSTLERIAAISSVSDRPPLATSGEGTLALLSQDALRATYRLNGILELYDPHRGRLTGVTPLSYVTGVLPVSSNENVSAHLLVGHFGPEIGLLCESANREGALTLAASDALPAQAVLFATAQYPLLGEELYAVPAYLQAGPAYMASIRVQDLLRWGVMIALVLIIIIGLLGGL